MKIIFRNYFYTQQHNCTKFILKKALKTSCQYNIIIIKLLNRITLTDCVIIQSDVSDITNNVVGTIIAISKSRHVFSKSKRATTRNESSYN